MNIVRNAKTFKQLKSDICIFHFLVNKTLEPNLPKSTKISKKKKKRNILDVSEIEWQFG